jgi:hypothetical protein
MGFADYLGEPGCFDSCEAYSAFELELRAKEDNAYATALGGRSPLDSEKLQRKAQDILSDAEYDRKELEPLVRVCDKSVCAVGVFCASKTVEAS